jgi:Na+/melibiose symporter-like transporter
MPSPITSDRVRLDTCLRCGFKQFYTTLIFFSIHWAIVVYINSSFLEQFFTQQIISLLYIIGSCITIISFFIITKALNRFGNIHLVLILTILEISTLIGMAYTHTSFFAGFLFILHHAIVPLILFSLDALMEGLIGQNESVTGGKRGVFLTIGSFALACTTLSLGVLVGNDIPNFMHVYLASAIFLIPFLGILIHNFSEYTDPSYATGKAIENICMFWKNKDIRNVFFAHLLLQFFFAWMVVYTPIYLKNEMGFTWDQIGSILFVGLLAYVLFEYAIGYLADTYFGEKEMMAFGFAIISISTASFLFLDNTSVSAWMAVMFMTRMGASFVETTTESYFFKHTHSADMNLVGTFRIAQPLGYILGPALGGILLLFFPPHFIFVFLGICMIPGLFFTMALHDTL